MIETLNNIDTEVFLFLNGHHCSAMDWPMWFLSSRWSWLIALVAAYLVVALMHDKRRWWLPLAAIGLCFLLADRGSVMLFKDTVCRLRPCHARPDVHLFREGCGGQYGFVSSHAANAFALVTFFWLRYRRKKNSSNQTIKQSRIVPICLLVWAVLVCYSRIYLGKHYPGDILCGALFGLLVGWVVWWLTDFFEKKFLFRETKS
jgi:undecaprenyl-diphosphatase